MKINCWTPPCHVSLSVGYYILTIMIKYSWHTILSTLYIIHYYALQLGPCLSFLFDKIHRRLNPWRENNDIILMLRERKLQLQLKWKVSSVLVVVMWSDLSKWEHFISLSLSLFYFDQEKRQRIKYFTAGKRLQLWEL